MHCKGRTSEASETITKRNLNIHVSGVSEREEKEDRAEKLF